MSNDYFREGNGQVARVFANLMVLQSGKESCRYMTNKEVLLLFGIISKG